MRSHSGTISLNIYIGSLQKISKALLYTNSINNKFYYHQWYYYSVRPSIIKLYTCFGGLSIKIKHIDLSKVPA